MVVARIVLASRLIYAWPLPAHALPIAISNLPKPTTKWALTNQLSGHHLGAFSYWTRFIWKQCAVWQCHSNLSDLSAMEIRVRIRVALFLHFSRRI